MSIAVVTGSSGLVGSETCKRFAAEGLDIIGIDNDMRAQFFGAEASTAKVRRQLETTVRGYSHHEYDIRDAEGINGLFRKLGRSIEVVVHTAAQPSHDWAARAPLVDFGVNALGTLHLLEATRQHCPEAAFIFTSTNKVYGDLPNHLPLVEQTTRWELPLTHPFYQGINETLSIDQSLHSLFGAGKAAADLLVQEYGRYFGMKTVCFRGGCLTGPAHSAAEWHGFLAYLMKCAVSGRPYRVFGYQGKQVRDNIHSSDLVQAFWQFTKAPRPAAVYNMGGGRHSNCSVLEAIALCEEIAGKKMEWSYVPEHRLGDHIWWLSDVALFRSHYPNWRWRYGLREILVEIHDACRSVNA